jgi:hypothetical protein
VVTSLRAKGQSVHAARIQFRAHARVLVHEEVLEAKGATTTRRYRLVKPATPSAPAPAATTSPHPAMDKLAEGPGALGVETRPPAPAGEAHPPESTADTVKGASAEDGPSRVASTPVDGSRRVPVDETYEVRLLARLGRDLDYEIEDLERRLAVARRRRDQVRELCTSWEA